MSYSWKQLLELPLGDLIEQWVNIIYIPVFTYAHSIYLFVYSPIVSSPYNGLVNAVILI